MINFFRKTRKKLADDNKPMKYMRYAIGEIILVVIGILIALSINNWNEERKVKKVRKVIFSIVKEDLQDDIMEIDNFLKDYKEIRKPIFETVLVENPKAEDWKNNPQYRRVFMVYPQIAINHRGFDLINNQTFISSNIKINISSEITLFYNKYVREVEVAEQQLSKEFEDNNLNFKNFEWLSDLYLEWVSDHYLKKDSTGFIDYVTTSPDAKNRMTTYWTFYKLYVLKLNAFKENALELISKIDAELEV